MVIECQEDPKTSNMNLLNLIFFSVFLVHQAKARRFVCRLTERPKNNTSTG